MARRLPRFAVVAEELHPPELFRLFVRAREEAGCVVTDIRGKPLDFSKGRGLEANEGILGAPPTLHARLLAAIQRVLPPMK